LKSFVVPKERALKKLGTGKITKKKKQKIASQSEERPGKSDQKGA
jgi:hypothetical protein